MDDRGGEAVSVPKQVECYLKRLCPQPTARLDLTGGPAFNNSRSPQSKKHKGNLLWFSPHSEALRKLKRVTFFVPLLKIRRGKRILLYTLPYRHAGHNELKKRGPLTGHFKSRALSHISFLFSSQNLSLFLGFALNFGLVLEGGGGRIYYLT